MAGTRIKIRDRNEGGNYARKRICCAVATASVLVLAIFLGLNRNTMTVDRMGSTEAIDFSSLAATVIPLDEFGANGNNTAVTQTSSLGLSATSGMKSDFMQATAVSPRVGLPNTPSTETSGGEAAVLAASWRATTP
jgi:hypothetical protein